MLCRLCALLGHLRLSKLPSSLTQAPRLGRDFGARGAAFIGRISVKTNKTYENRCICASRRLHRTRARAPKAGRGGRGDSPPCAFFGTFRRLGAPRRGVHRTGQAPARRGAVCAAQKRHRGRDACARDVRGAHFACKQDRGAAKRPIFKRSTSPCAATPTGGSWVPSRRIQK